MNESTPVIAVDLAQSVFEIAVSRTPGRVAERQRLSRSRFLRYFARRESSRVLLEACGSAHHWARELAGLGHEVVLLPPHRVRRYRVGNKTDRADAKALLEAHRNEELRPVPVKTVAQQTLQALHRLRDGWKKTRTARINAVRGILRELGHVLPGGARHVVPRVRELVASTSALPEPLRVVLTDACLEIDECTDRIEATQRQLEALGASIPAVARLQSVPGIGPLTATALVACVGDVHRFRSSRQLASYLGLTPREHSSGARRMLGSISKCGNRYLRMLLVTGGRSALLAAGRTREPDTLQAWGLRVQQRIGHNKAAVAMANKIVRMAWAVWREDRLFRAAPRAA